ncbi:TadE/TadG family type IV pilus assembly protein [Endozoicomonas sp. ALB115]|uniref:TadE/TadG family type IV pilus assembly protein n=1 Tax=Endozoicomonas sp. ALB115 TaxID=3403074 RepID=UPI003BB4F378
MNRRSRQQQKGSTVVEFSIAASVFFLILFGVMEFGRVMYTFHLLQESTRRAARVAVVSTKDSAAIWTAANNVVSDLKEGQLKVTYLVKKGTQLVTVKIEGYQIKLLLPIPESLTITAPAFTTTQIAESLGA